MNIKQTILDVEYVQASTTTGNKEDAENIAKRLVKQKLAACVQVLGPINSTYWWKGKMETREEWLCLIKSKRKLYKRLEEAIRSIHPYEVPEIIAVPITVGSEGYLEWLNSVLTST